MKTSLLFLIVIVLFTACKKDDPKPELKTTFRIINNSSNFQSTVKYLDGTLWEVVIFSFKGEDVIKQDNIDSVSYEGGISKEIELDLNCEKVKVSIKLLPPKSQFYSLSSNARKYMTSYVIIQKNKLNDVTIDDNTMFGSNLKSTGKTLNELLNEIK